MDIKTIQIQYCSTALLHLEELLETTNVNLKIRHIRLLIEYRYDQLGLGGTWTDSLETQKRRRLQLDITATPTRRLEAGGAKAQIREQELRSDQQGHGKTISTIRRILRAV
ncbi:MAG: hypothetical protein CBC48_20870 [bacterium TMED88]|nr:hypothetical protein [Deltaproteobacteria bacterium]OUV20959.1 MAG: hypothetical protein CBC48_20870 [bacterium TMED88]